MIEDGDVTEKKIESGEENMRVLLNRVTKLRVFDVEYIYGFVIWGGLQAKSMTSQRAAFKMADMRYYCNVMTTTRWRLCVTMFYIFNSTVID